MPTPCGRDDALITTDGSVIAGSSAARAVKSVRWRVSCEVEVTRVEQRAYIKISFLQGRSSPCDFDLTSKIKEPIRGKRFATREEIANAVCQQVTQFTHGAANAESDGIQRLLHLWQRVVTVSGVYIESL
ncbi:uncharacterized protein TNCV_2011301 [Trichonephila clavipes]|nr:uncharacterized protein TNCV_2011301 [Trichonephila clavipes]